MLSSPCASIQCGVEEEVVITVRNTFVHVGYSPREVRRCSVPLSWRMRSECSSPCETSTSCAETSSMDATFSGTESMTTGDSYSSTSSDSCASQTSLESSKASASNMVLLNADNTSIVVSQEQATWTCLMLRNLPQSLNTSKLASLFVDVGLLGKFDFVYVPRSFRTKAGLGYGFVNVASVEHVADVALAMRGFNSWPSLGSSPSEKVCEVRWASVELQGLEANVMRYRDSPLMHSRIDASFKPQIFDASGEAVMFPAPQRKLRAPRYR